MCHARSGFFQLLPVGFVSLATTWMLRPSLRDRAHRVLAAAVAAGNLGIVAVAIRRLFLYEAAYGLTPLRGAGGARSWLGWNLGRARVDEARRTIGRGGAHR